MNDLDFLTAVQQQTNTEPIVVDENYKDVFLLLFSPDFDEAESKKLLISFDEAIATYKTVVLPTQYESIVHYPSLLQLLRELYSTANEIGVINNVNPEFSMPLIGTADLVRMGAYAKTDYNTIIIDRGLLSFFFNLTRILVDLIVSEEGTNWVIRPSLLTVEEIQNRILSNHSIIRDYIETMTSYVKFGNAIPFSKHLKFHNSQKSSFSNMISLETWRFIVAHEMIHLLYKHRQSTPSVELEADRMAIQLCAKCVEKIQPETQFYWVPVFVVATLDVLMECNQISGINCASHPIKRGEYAHFVLEQMKSGGHALAMAQAVRRIHLLLWGLTKTIIIELATDVRIKEPNQLCRKISMIHFST